MRDIIFKKYDFLYRENLIKKSDFVDFLSSSGNLWSAKFMPIMALLMKGEVLC